MGGESAQGEARVLVRAVHLAVDEHPSSNDDHRGVDRRYCRSFQSSSAPVLSTRAKIGAINAIVDLDSHGPSGLP
eukprot:COSAG06_NODE_1810_length_8327_cov_2.800802_1_plen_74_part_10